MNPGAGPQLIPFGQPFPMESQIPQPSTDPTPNPAIAQPGGDVAPQQLDAPSRHRYTPGYDRVPPPTVPAQLPETNVSDGSEAAELPENGIGFNDDSDSGEDDLSDEPLPPLADELWLHGGSYLYAPEGDRLQPPPAHEAHSQLLRLPEWWRKPEPLTAFQEFLGADPIKPTPDLKWFGPEGFQWEPRFVGYGGYTLFGQALESGGRRRDGVGHQLLVDLDLRLTSTERFHMQFRPLGRKNTGGSFYQLNDPVDYDDNSTGIPDRYWFEFEVFSLISDLVGEEFTPRDYHVVAGKFPFLLHNRLLMNDDVLGVAVNKNTILIPPFSNLNIQVFAALDDVDAVDGASSSELYGMHWTADYRHALLEATVAYLLHTQGSDRDAGYTAFSATQFFGPWSLAGRVLGKWNDEGGTGDGQLYVFESNFVRSMPEGVVHATGIEHAVYYLNAFKATSGWNSISGGNFNRLRSTFEVNPLTAISTGARRTDDTLGAALGVQLFRRHDDESFIPEVAWEQPGGEAVWGVGLRWQRKLNARMFLDLQGVKTWSDARQFQREGVFLSTTALF